MNDDVPDIPWAAGLFDGEGTVLIRRRLKPGQGAKNPMYYVEVSIATTTGHVAKLFRAWFGGYVSRRHRAQYPTRRIIYRWRSAAQKAVAFLRLVQPHLRIKHHEVEIALRLQRLVDQQKHRPNPHPNGQHGGGNRFTITELAEREALYQLLLHTRRSAGERLGVIAELAS